MTAVLQDWEPGPNYASLDGQVAIVTGAGSRGSGIGNGRAAAIMLARRGARVVLVDSSPEWADETARLVKDAGGDCCTFSADVSDASDCAAVVDAAVNQFESVDILVNNVGIGGPQGTAVDVDEAEWDHILRVNVTSMMLMSKFAIPHMTKLGKNSIVNVASASGLQGGHPNLGYPTTKGAVVNLTRAMAAHHGPQGIRVNCVAPGMVTTPMVWAHGMTEELRQTRLSYSLLPYEGTGWDVGMAVAWLASDEARWVTGAIIPVDGGVTAAVKGKPTLR